MFKNGHFVLIFFIGSIIDFLSFANKNDMMDQSNDNFSDQEELNINADENLSGTEHLTDPIEDTDTELETLETALAESKDKYLRLAAEFDNFRKRTAKERIELFQTAGRDIITELLDVLDDVDRAAPELEKFKDKELKKGVELIFGKLKNILHSKGLKKMEAIGAEFDPELHEAVTEIPAPNEEMKGKVIDDITSGYYLNDKIIRHAKVVVGK